MASFFTAKDAKIAKLTKFFQFFAFFALFAVRFLSHLNSCLFQQSQFTLLFYEEVIAVRRGGGVGGVVTAVSHSRAVSKKRGAEKVTAVGKLFGGR